MAILSIDYGRSAATLPELVSLLNNPGLTESSLKSYFFPRQLGELCRKMRERSSLTFLGCLVLLRQIFP